MTHRQHTSCYVSRLVVSLLLSVLLIPAAHSQKMFRIEKDSIPFFRGFAVSVDLVGPAMLMLSDHGEIEGALRLNLHDQWFPVFEMGVGHANHKRDEITQLSYKTTAPYFRLGFDLNCMKNKHLPNRIYAGLRYAFTTFKCDIWSDQLEDKVYKTRLDFGEKGISCAQHWVEFVFGLDAQIYGPLHMGWTVRYLRRLYHKEGALGPAWYVPGWGIYDNAHFNGNVNISVDI